ncbi:MAG: UDP-3-O-(3-hydroxymyristoyl)glucosamine N-acyltransferase [Reinekea sp.]|jgi:UDP-3-O-[3-hydroxymyristoyl] glucosamine N-acyltransferase
MITVADVLKITGSESEVSEPRLHVSIDSVAPLDSATANQLSFLSSPKYRRDLSTTGAGVVLVRAQDVIHCPATAIAIIVEDPYLAYAKVSQSFDLSPHVVEGIHATAIIAESASIGRHVRIAAHVVIGEGVVIGDYCEIGANSVIEDYVIVGAYTRMRNNVTVAHRCQIGQSCVLRTGSVIGESGFGFAPKPDGWEPIAQVGRVILGDRVDIGANTTVDRGAISDTVVADDVIIDNLVHVGHNVRLGKRTALAGQSGVAGSTEIGEGCTLGGQAGITGHVKIANNSHFTGQAMVTKGTTQAGVYSSGLPAQDAREWRKMVSRVRQLENMLERLNHLESRLADKESE